MKKAFRVMIRKIGFSFLLGCLFLFNMSCGLDSFEYFDGPEVVIGTIPEASKVNVSFENCDFEFYTNEPTVQFSTIKYLGTDVYYKIYNSPYQLEYEVTRLIDKATSSENSGNAFSTMADEYGYCKLYGEGYEKNDVLIPSKGTFQDVYIRLTDYGDTSNYSARIIVDDKNYNNDINLIRPVRYLRNENRSISFNFGRYNDELIDNRPVYVAGDVDVRNSSDSTVESNKWYVAMFAVGVARDMNYSLQYSNILYLGNVMIDSSSKDN